MGAPIFFHLSYGTYGTLAYGESVKSGGIKLPRDITVFRKMPISPSDPAQNLAFFIYLDHRLKINTALNPEFLQINTNKCGTE
jgi:hypothetical protein